MNTRARPVLVARWIWAIAALVPLVFTSACAVDPKPIETATLNSEPVDTSAAASSPALADVLAVQVSGSSGGFQFSVEVRSPDEGCEQYADWWEVITEDGDLLYRRILAHSHVDEQPFTRSGGPIAVGADTVVLVRAHMHPSGYGGVALIGSVDGGFERAEIGADAFDELEREPPLPTGCAF